MNRLQDAVKRYFPGKADALLVTSPVSRRYLLGFPSSAGTLVLLPDKQYFLIDFRYVEKARQVIQGCEVLLQEKLYDQINEILSANQVRTVGLEDAAVTLRELEGYRERLCAEPVLHSGLSELLEEMRAVKSADEIETLVRAQEITDRAFSEILHFIRAGVSEKEIACELEYRMKRLGADGLSFDTIAVAGKNSSLPHGVPTDYRVQPGDFVTMDFGALLDGYHADMTRTVAVGSVSREQRAVYDTVLQAQERALAAIRAGVSCHAVDAVARDYIESAGYQGCFGHGLGHSVGLEIHEDPRFSPTCGSVLRAGMVLSVEPGIYLSGRFGVRIEDLVVIEEHGVRNLT